MKELYLSTPKGLDGEFDINKGQTGGGGEENKVECEANKRNSTLLPSGPAPERAGTTARKERIAVVRTKSPLSVSAAGRWVGHLYQTNLYYIFGGILTSKRGVVRSCTVLYHQLV